MLRRTLLRNLSQMLSTLPFLRSRAYALGDTFSSQERAALNELAVLVLPSALGKSGAETIATKFEDYLRGYRGGADTDHGYGFTHVVPKPPSPAATYAKQLLSFPSPLNKAAVEQALQAAAVKDLPRVPDGKSVVADLMSFYFRSSDANDLCYEASIGRDQCRGLAGSDQRPAPLRRPA